MRVVIHKFYKSLWSVRYRLLMFYQTRVFRMKLWLNNVEFGRNVRANGGKCPQLRVSPWGKHISIGDNFVTGNYSDAGWNARTAIYVKAGATLIIGDNSGINGGLIYCTELISIGNHVKIGGGTRIMDTDFHPLEYVKRRYSNEGARSKPITIENDVFIGAGCIILKGVTIGARSIIAAGSVVTKSIPSDEIWGGSPANFIRKI